jgi:peroxiredoxin
VIRLAPQRLVVQEPQERQTLFMTDFTTLPDDLPVPEDDGAAEHLPGAALPHLTLPASDGTRIDLGALGDGRTVLYLYPLTGRPGVDLPAGWDEIPGARGCSTEACDFRDHFADLRAAGAGRVYGLSSQEPDYQAEVVERLRLPFVCSPDIRTPSPRREERCRVSYPAEAGARSCAASAVRDSITCRAKARAAALPPWACSRWARGIASSW